jgi:hypothetical protein
MAAFEQPAVLPYELRLENVSLAELMANPAAWEITLKHLPDLKMMVSSSMMKPYLSNFDVHTVSAFIAGFSPEVIATINQELSRLPSAQEMKP